VTALIVGALTLYSMSIVWTDAFWRSPPKTAPRTRGVPPAMVGAMALLAACTLGVGLAVEPVSGFARAAAEQMLPRATAEPDASSVTGAQMLTPTSANRRSP
jgi:multicomponent Na+:H+ antiporter subunit D